MTSLVNLPALSNGSNMVENITSTSNQLVKFVRTLHDKQTRRETGLCLLEGETLIHDAYDAGVEIKQIFTAQPHLFENLPVTEIYQVSGKLLEYMTTTTSAPMAIAIAKPQPIDRPIETNFAIYLESIQDPGNLGSIIRSAFAAGVDTVYLSEGSVDIYNSKVIRASAGAVFRGIIEIKSLESLKPKFNRVIATSSVKAGAKDYCQLKLKDSDKVLLLMGSEGKGLTDASIAAATDLVQIPMATGIESLNVLAATSILLFKIRELNETRTVHSS